MFLLDGWMVPQGDGCRQVWDQDTRNQTTASTVLYPHEMPDQLTELIDHMRLLEPTVKPRDGRKLTHLDPVSRIT